MGGTVDFSKTLFNKSSVSHNIITNECKKSSGFDFTSGILDRKIHYHKKSISQFVDEGCPNNPKVNPQFQRVCEENPHLFKRMVGLCTFYGDAAIRHSVKPPLARKATP